MLRFTSVTADSNAVKGRAGIDSNNTLVSLLVKFTRHLGRNRKHNVGLLATVASLALATHLLFFLHFGNHYVVDSAEYINPASNLIVGRGFTDSEGHPEANRTPGYPLLIVPFLWVGADLKYLVLFQHLLQVLLTVGATASAFKLSGSRRQALIVGILLSIDLPTLGNSNLVLTETLFTVALAATLWLLWRGARQPEQGWIRFVLPGLAAGVAALIRPIGLYFFLPVTVYLLATRSCSGLRAWSRLRAVVGFIAGFACLPLLWAGRNYRETGRFAVTSAAGIEVICCRAAGILALDDPGDFNTNIARRRAELENAACRDLLALHGRPCSELSVAEKSEQYMRVGRKVILEHPVGYVRLALRGAAVLLLDGDSASLQGFTGINPHLGIRLLLLYTVPLLFFGLLGLGKLWKKDRQLFWLCFLTIAYFVALSSGGESYSRYRVPFAPVYAILIARGVSAVSKPRMLRKKLEKMISTPRVSSTNAGARTRTVCDGSNTPNI